MKEQIKIVFVTDSKTTNELFLMESAHNKFEMYSVDTDGVVEMRQVMECNEATEESQTKEVEWVNGDECIFVGEEYTFGCINPICDQGSVVIFDETGDYHGCYIGELSKPETKQQREDRGRLESAKYLYSKYCAAVRHPVKDLDGNSELLNAWLVIVDEANYKVKGE